MIFKRRMVDLVLIGQKTQTRRRMSDKPRSPWFRDGSRLPKIGEEIPVQPGRNEKAVARVRVLEVGPQELGRITDYEAQAEGFAGREEFFTYWREMHGVVDFTEDVWVVGFDLVAELDSDPCQSPTSTAPMSSGPSS